MGELRFGWDKDIFLVIKLEREKFLRFRIGLLYSRMGCSYSCIKMLDLVIVKYLDFLMKFIIIVSIFYVILNKYF